MLTPCGKSPGIVSRHRCASMAPHLLGIKLSLRTCRTKSLLAQSTHWVASTAQVLFAPSLVATVGSQSSRKNSNSHIDASHSRQPLVKGERLVRYEVNAVMALVSVATQSWAHMGEQSWCVLGCGYTLRSDAWCFAMV